MIGLTDPLVAYALDEALAARLGLEEQRLAAEARHKGPKAPPGLRYETAGEAMGRPN